MAYIPGYDYDIFISYAHLDNEMLPGQEQGWIETFYKSLNLKLAQRVGKADAVKIWWDSKRLDGSKLFDQSIQDGVQNSAIMISLISPSYLKSDYCIQEYELFYKKSQTEKIGLSVGNHSRFIKIFLNNIPYTGIPENLEKFGKSTGFPFYFAENKDDFGDPIDTANPMFIEQLKNLRDALVDIFANFQKQLIAQPKAPCETSKDKIQKDTKSDEKFTIFFGEVPDDLRSIRKKTIFELKNEGFEIVTGIPPPDTAEAHEEKIREELTKADLAVHLLNQFPGREIDGTDTWFTKKQVDLTMEISKNKLIWVPSELNLTDIEDESYKVFLNTLEVNNSPDNKFDYIRGNKSELKFQISEYVNEIKFSRVKKVSQEKISILLDTHFCDQQYAYGLVQTLLQNNIQPYVNPEEGDPRKNLNLLADRISQANKLVFLYGSVERDWVIERVSAALQLIVTNNYAIDDFYIYLAPPIKMDDDIKLNQRFLKINILNNSADNSVTNGILDKFILNLKSSA